MAVKPKSSKKNRKRKRKPCRRCGDCCDDFTIIGPIGPCKDIRELMKTRPKSWRNWLYPARLKILYFDRWGRPWFTCRNLTEDRLCVRYHDRPDFCREYHCQQ